MAKKGQIKAKSLALAAAKVALDRHCQDVVVLDLRNISPATDYFVIATGSSDRQMRAVSDEISEAAREKGRQQRKDWAEKGEDDEKT